LHKLFSDVGGAPASVCSGKNSQSVLAQSSNFCGPHCTTFEVSSSSSLGHHQAPCVCGQQHAGPKKILTLSLKVSWDVGASWTAVLLPPVPHHLMIAMHTTLLTPPPVHPLLQTFISSQGLKSLILLLVQEASIMSLHVTSSSVFSLACDDCTGHACSNQEETKKGPPRHN